MSRNKAIVLALFTVWPMIYMMIFMGTILGTMLWMFLHGDQHSEPPAIFLIIVPLHLLTMLEMFVLFGIYIVHLFKTDRVKQDTKALWAVVLFMGNFIAMLVYWYLYIWKEPEQTMAEKHAGGTGGGAAEDLTGPL